MNVCQAAMQLDTPHVLGISTDKAAHPANCYGATKMLMEKIFAEYSRLGLKTQYHLVRYGNVLESNGSVIETWRKCVANNQPIKITSPAMTRFWLSPSQAVQYALDALELPSGHIFIPLLPALSIGKLAEYTLWENEEEWKKHPAVIIPLRPGEKVHESLLTFEEIWYCERCYGKLGEARDLRPTTTKQNDAPYLPLISDTAPELTKQELLDLLANG